MATLNLDYPRATGVVVGLFLLLCLLTLNYNGPFFDEGIYITAGIRTLEGLGFEDQFLTWFGGSLVWPLLVALGYRAGGLIGARAVAAVVATVGLGAFARAVRNVFDERASFWATLTFAVNGPFLALARLGVYDALALSGVAVAFWAVTELTEQDNRLWLGAAAVAYTLAVFAKYPIGLMLLPLVGTVFFLREDRAITDVLLLGFMVGALGLAFFLPLREQIGEFFSWRLQNRPEFGVPYPVIVFAIVYLSTAPFVLALVGWFVARERRWLASLMILSMALWPAYHLLTGDPVGTNKHLVFGYLFAYPLVGLTLRTIWGDGNGGVARKVVVLFIVLLMTGLGLVQVNQSDHSWPDARPAAGYLIEHVQPGQQLLINESWPYTMYLYTKGRIGSPWDVYDDYRITHEPSAPPVCEYDWLVDSRGSYAWPDDVMARMEQCGTFERVFSSTSFVINLGADFNYVSYPVDIIVWKNTSESQSSEPLEGQSSRYLSLTRDRLVSALGGY